MTNVFPSKAGGLLLTAGLAVLSGALTFSLWYQTLAPIQSSYLATYLTCEYMPSLSLFGRGEKPKRYSVITVNGKDATLATMPETMDGVGLRYTYTTPQVFGNWLQWMIYERKTPLQFAEVPLCLWGALCFLSLVAGTFLKKKGKQKAHDGVKLRGPDLLTRWQFNRQVKGDGFPLRLENRRNPLEWLQGESGRYLRIERKYENNHILTMADPGGGKSSLFFQILDEVARRGETAVIGDPHMQFISRYFNAERGDVVLNPMDARCPAWNPSAEIDLSDSALAGTHAMAQATSLFVGEPGDRNWFFTYTSQLIWRYILVNFQPNSHEMAHLLEHADPLIDIVVKGTELETMMGKNAPNQRAAVVGHLTQIAHALRQLPEESAEKKPFVLNDWCEHRKGWIFVTNTQKTRDSLRPIQSLWLDSLILNLLSQGERPDLTPVLMAIDELQTFQKLPQLMPMATEGRKSLRALMGFQGRSQIKSLYGDTAEAIFSAAFTKFFMRTTEDEASKWVSNMVGEVERERVKETRPAHAAGKGAHSYSSERVIEKLLLPAEFHGLRDREGYLKYGNLVVKFKLPIMQKIGTAPAFVPRKGNKVVKKPLPTLNPVEPEPEPVVTNSTFVAPTFHVIANNSTIHNQAVWPTPPKAVMPPVKNSAKPVAGERK